MTTLLLALVAFAAAMLLMAVGLFIRGTCFRASCGGEDQFVQDGDTATCSQCGRERSVDD